MTYVTIKGKHLTAYKGKDSKYYYRKEGRRVYTKSKVKNGKKPLKNSKKHPKSKSKRRVLSRIKTKGIKCKEQFTKKYTERPSPPYPANECCGLAMIGNNGRFYISKKASNGVCRWVLFK